MPGETRFSVLRKNQIYHLCHYSYKTQSGHAPVWALSCCALYDGVVAVVLA